MERPLKPVYLRLEILEAGLRARSGPDPGPDPGPDSGTDPGPDPGPDSGISQYISVISQYIGSYGRLTGILYIIP